MNRPLLRPIVPSTINKDPTSDIIYYNVIMTGNPNQTFSPAIYEETRTQPVLDDPSQYYLSVVRFSIDGSNIPIFVCPVIPDPITPTNVNNTPFVVTLSYGGVNYSANVQYFPSTDAPIPQIPTATSQDITSTYYYIYYYTSFIQMVNNAINVAFLALTTANPGLTGVQAPYFQYDPNTQLISYVTQNIINPLVAGINVYQTQFTNGVPQIAPQPAGTIYVYLNEQLYSFFDGIEAFEYINTSQNLILVRDLKDNYLYPAQNAANTTATQTETSFTSGTGTYTTQPAWFIFTQQYNMITKWNSLSSIVFLTNNLPVNKEYIPASSIVGVTSAGNASFRPILTDFVPELINAGDSRSRFNYFPQGPYRLIELNSQEPLRKIDLRIYWEDHFQNLYPLYISYGDCNSVKLMFMKKSLAKYNNQIAY